MADEGSTARDSRRSRGGGVPGTANQPAFTLAAAKAAPVPVLIAVPHAGRLYPPDFAAQMRHHAQASVRLEDRFADLVGEAVARQSGAALLVAHAPRAMIDLNRAPDDVDWDMIAGDPPAGRPHLAIGRRARSGLGLVPRRLPGLGELWKRRLAREELEERIARVHEPYHLALGRTLEMLRDRWGSALLIDLHSMPPLGPKRGAAAAADFVIGDRFGASCRSGLTAAALEYVSAQGYRAAHNRPYAGGYVLDRHAAPARGLHAMQVEVCRSTYLDAAGSDIATGLADISAMLAGLVRCLADELATGQGLAQAAE